MQLPRGEEVCGVDFYFFGFCFVLIAETACRGTVSECQNAATLAELSVRCQTEFTCPRFFDTIMY